MYHDFQCLFRGIKTGSVLRALALRLMMVLYAATSFAQKVPASGKAADTTGTRLASRLGISQAKARKVASAMRYKSAEIKAVIADTLQKPSVRQAKLKALMQERSQYLRTALGPKMMDSLRTIDPRGREHHSSARGRQGKSIGRDQRPGAGRRDTIINHPSYQPRTKL